MSLSAHERTQFARLTAGLELGDPSILKKMAKKDKATTMHYIPLPNRSAVMLFIVLINFCVFAGSVLANNGTAAMLTGVFGTLLGAVVVRNSITAKSSGIPTATRQVQRVRTESANGGYSLIARIRVPSVSKNIMIAMLIGIATIPVLIYFGVTGNLRAALATFAAGMVVILSWGIMRSFKS